MRASTPAGRERGRAGGRARTGLTCTCSGLMRRAGRAYRRASRCWRSIRAIRGSRPSRRAPSSGGDDGRRRPAARPGARAGRRAALRSGQASCGASPPHSPRLMQQLGAAIVATGGSRRFLHRQPRQLRRHTACGAGRARTNGGGGWKRSRHVSSPAKCRGRCARRPRGLPHFMAHAATTWPSSRSNGRLQRRAALADTGAGRRDRGARARLRRGAEQRRAMSRRGQARRWSRCRSRFPRWTKRPCSRRCRAALVGAHADRGARSHHLGERTGAADRRDGAGLPRGSGCRC